MRRLARIGIAALVIVAGLSVLYGWALLNLDTSQVARYIVWLDSDVDDWRRFPSRTVAAGHDPVELVSPGTPDPGVAAISVDGRPLATFLEANETTAFLVARGETLVYELYPNGSSREAIQTSFSVAKSFASTLVGMAAREGRLTLDDSVATFIPELLGRDPRYQFIFVDPAADVTIVRMGRDYGSLDYLRWIDLFSTVAAAASTGTPRWAFAELPTEPRQPPATSSARRCTARVPGLPTTSPSIVGSTMD